MATPDISAVSLPAIASSGFKLSKENHQRSCFDDDMEEILEHFAVAVPVALVAAVGGFLVGLYISKRSCKKGQVNLSISKDSPKVVHSFDMEDIGTKAVYCRCWKSKKFPYCDGAHTKHNEETGDNVGPLIIKKKDA